VCALNEIQTPENRLANERYHVYVSSRRNMSEYAGDERLLCTAGRAIRQNTNRATRLESVSPGTRVPAADIRPRSTEDPPVNSDPRLTQRGASIFARRLRRNSDVTRHVFDDRIATDSVIRIRAAIGASIQQRSGETTRERA